GPLAHVLLAGPPALVPPERRPSGREIPGLGHPPPHGQGPQERHAAKRHPELLPPGRRARGHRIERRGRPRSTLVAEPEDPSRRRGARRPEARQGPGTRG